MAKLTLEQIDKGIAALVGVDEYLTHIMDDETLDWCAWEEVLSTAASCVLKFSVEQRRRLVATAEEVSAQTEEMQS
jgi:hypothetical protein